MKTVNGVYVSMISKVVRRKIAAKFTMVLMPCHALGFGVVFFCPRGLGKSYLLCLSGHLFG